MKSFILLLEFFCTRLYEILFSNQNFSLLYEILIIGSIKKSNLFCQHNSLRLIYKITIWQPDF